MTRRLTSGAWASWPMSFWSETLRLRRRGTLKLTAAFPRCGQREKAEWERGVSVALGLLIVCVCVCVVLEAFIFRSPVSQRRIERRVCIDGRVHEHICVA